MTLLPGYNKNLTDWLAKTFAITLHLNAAQKWTTWNDFVWQHAYQPHSCLPDTLLVSTFQTVTPIMLAHFVISWLDLFSHVPDLLRGTGTVSVAKTQTKSFYLPSEKRSTLKGKKNCSLVKQKVAKAFSLVKNGKKNLAGVSSRFKSRISDQNNRNLFNLCTSNELFCINSLDRSISNSRVSG